MKEKKKNIFINSKEKKSDKVYENRYTKHIELRKKRVKMLAAGVGLT